ncbi:hypothetical protein KUV85_10415 [Nocardioides panacisoli]|uniref:hypothetical protein n=1 Tax=Nocardioides panacisoli TaxID=627624 RepID=UPI001C62B5FE|nr:hypothetical protein [Nocardioides panacisoli]QYJ02752.1 hypothetical protein KUV85_10415 [Nocardioides panacisoli]
MRRLALLGSVLALAAACSSAGTGAGSAEEATDDAPASEVVAESPSAPATTEEPEATIRDFDFGTVRWREAVAGEFRRIGTDDVGRVFAVGDTAYADVNDDGHDDALVGLEITDGNGYEQIFYIWTWDAAKEKAVQVENPIAREFRCGDAVEKVAGGDGAFTITERLRFQGQDLPDCAATPPIKVQRSVRLEDNWPVLTTGQGGHGGICPQPQGTDALFDLEGIPVHPGPREETGTLDASVVTKFAEVDVWDHLWLYRENWMLIHFLPASRGAGDGFAEYGDYVPCGWVYLEDDQRPIPH